MGLKLLILAMIWMILFFAMLLIDSLLIVLFDHPGYSEFLFVGYGIIMLFYTFSYLSLFMPQWLVKRIEKQ